MNGPLTISPAPFKQKERWQYAGPLHIFVPQQLVKNNAVALQQLTEAFSFAVVGVQIIGQWRR